MASFYQTFSNEKNRGNFLILECQNCVTVMLSRQTYPSVIVQILYAAMQIQFSLSQGLLDVWNLHFYSSNLNQLSNHLLSKTLLFTSFLE